ncbi:tRNA lysidine(34) synthetase TilS [Orbus sturtevantii]
MNNFLKSTLVIQKTVQEKIIGHHHLLVAYSGGVDSSVLLHSLVMLKHHHLPNLDIKAIYIHHGISDNADIWADHCRTQCNVWQIPLIIEKVSLAVDDGNIEEQARDARYKVIQKYLTQNVALCTAQHLDDQSETFLLALKRGSGPTGLSAMPESSKIAENLLLRPLLTISRQQIEQYAKEYNLAWVEDESNQDPYYDRNFLRLNVLPMLNQRWPHFNQMVARSAELCHEQQQLLDELLSVTFEQLIDKQLNLSITPLLSFSSAKRNTLLRMWFKQNKVAMPSRKQLTMIWQNVALAKEDSNPQFILHDKQIRRYQGKLYLLPNYQNLQSVRLNWQNLDTPLILPDNLGKLSITNTLPNCCRLPNQGENIWIGFYVSGMHHVVGRNGSRQIKKLWQEFGIPPWMRNRIPLVFYDETLITAVSIFVTKQGQGDDVCYQHQAY